MRGSEGPTPLRKIALKSLLALRLSLQDIFSRVGLSIFSRVALVERNLSHSFPSCTQRNS